MSQSLGLDYDPKYEGFDPRYPSPPRVHWTALLLGWFAAAIAVAICVPDKYNDLAQSLLFDGWVFYLCHWIRRLNPEAKSPFWCDIYVVIQLTAAGLGAFAPISMVVSILVLVLSIVWLILGIATIFMVKSDLEDHYNNREHVGLLLSGGMTFFFSFLYFQHHLYQIAKRKQAAQSLMAGQLS